MTIDFVEDKQIDFQPNNNIDFQTDKNIDFQPEKKIVLQGGVEENVEYNPYNAILNDNTLTKEQKVQRIKEQGQKELKEIKKQHRIEMAKLYGGAALEIGSCLIPFGGAANIGGRVALKLAKPLVTQIAKKAIVKGIGSGIASGLASGAMFGAGNALVNDENIVEGTLKGAGEGAIGGGAIGGVAGKIATKIGRTGKVVDKLNNRNAVKNAELESVKEKIRDLIHIRRSNIDFAKYDASQKINKFISQTDDIAKELKIDSKKLREIMPFIRENTDLPSINFNRPDLKKIYKNLTSDQKEVLRMIADNHFNDMETYWNELASVKNLKSNMSPDEYITHIWDLSANDKNLLTNFIRTKSKFEKGRIVPTYKQGIEKGVDIIGEDGLPVHINLRPKTLDYAEIQKLHANELIDSAENTKFLNEYDGLKFSNGKFANSHKEIKDIAEPVLESSNESVYMQKLANKLVHKAKNSYDMVNNFAKGCKFLFNGMHAVALTESSAAHSTNILPFKTIKTLGNIPKIIDGIKNNNYALFKESKLAKQALKDGVQFGAISDINVGEFNTFLDGFSKVLDKVTLGASKPLTGTARKLVNTNNKFLWNYLHNTYKLHTYDTLIKRVSKNGKVAISDNVRKDIAQLVNDTFGGQNWDTLGIKPSTVKTSQRLLLSPDWNMSATIRQSLAVFSSESGQKFLNKFAQSSKFGSAVREFSRKLGISSFVNDVQGAGVRGQQARRFFMTFLAQTAIYSNAINACSRVVDSIQDKEKYPDGVTNLSVYDNNRFDEKNSKGKKIVDTLFPRPYVGQNEYGREVYARVGKQALEMPELLEDMPNSLIRKTASKTSPLINPIVTKISDKVTDNWNKESIKDRYKDTFTPFSLNKKDKFKPVDMLYSTSKGLNSYQAREYLKECVLKGDTDAIEKFKPKMKSNKIDFNRAMKRVLQEIAREQNDNTGN